MVLFRPVGSHELTLIRNLEYRAFPPRLDIQPIFYPVLNEDYAIQIARDWNTKDKASGYVGYVTRFEVDDDYVSKFERKIVGAKVHEELWVPAEELDEFNSHILGIIDVIHAFHSEEYIVACNDSNLPSWWQETLARYRGAAWQYVNDFPCHTHCMLCDATLCSIHPARSGDDFSEGYRMVLENGLGLAICMPCFVALDEKYGLKRAE